MLSVLCYRFVFESEIPPGTNSYDEGVTENREHNPVQDQIQIVFFKFVIKTIP